MSQIIQQGSLNTTALVVPDVYVQILAPAVAYLNGVPTNVVGLVGVASWGPVNSPITVGNGTQLVASVGPVTNRSYDLATHASVLIQNGCGNMRLIRVSDGTDVAATAAIKDTTTPTPVTGLTLTAIYTGIVGNSLQATVSAGTAASTYCLTFQLPGQAPEVFNNISGTGAAFWQNAASAINNGQSGIRGPSKFFTAAVGTATLSPAVATYTASGGTDGATTITTAKLIGVDGGLGTRTGIYALRGTGASVAAVCDCYDSTSWATQVAYGLSEGTYMITTGAPGQTPAVATAARQTAGIDSYALKILLGDWIYWADNVNGVTRMLSPATFYAGLLGNQAPQNSGLNKQVYGVVATQSSQASQQYSSADIQTLVQGGVDVICNPVPGGSYFGPRIGHNSSSNNAVWGDNYTRMTNYVSSTLAAGMGFFVGYNQSSQPNDQTRAQAKAKIDSFLQNMQDQNQIDSFSTICDLTNNSVSRIALGYLQVDVTVKYLAVVEKLLVNLQGGQTVTVAKISTTPVGNGA